jgi:hypothetical protein
LPPALGPTKEYQIRYRVHNGGGAGLRAFAARWLLAMVLPAVYPFRHFVEVGGLLSYANDLSDNFRRAASYGQAPVKFEMEFPVQTPVKIEMVINRKTAKALGLTIAPNDEVIE